MFKCNTIILKITVICKINTLNYVAYFLHINKIKSKTSKHIFYLKKNWWLITKPFSLWPFYMNNTFTVITIDIDPSVCLLIKV